jgi:hypothetical protein
MPTSKEDKISRRRKADAAVEEAQKMMLDGFPLEKVIRHIHLGCRFDWGDPVDVEGALPLALNIYSRLDSGNREDIGECLLLLGRIFTARGEHLTACRFYLCSTKTVPGLSAVPAMEFFREQIREWRGQIGMDRDAFEEKYSGDTPDALVGEYAKPSAGPERRGHGKWNFNYVEIAMSGLQVFGVATTVILLKHLTALPIWACFLVGVPLFIGVFLTIVYFATRGGGGGT